uniref:Uncharacterized protein n=1 Tax=viral metagenome TaxID=1070528 RepID=A0A6H1ZKS4_9ZZZZ
MKPFEQIKQQDDFIFKSILNSIYPSSDNCSLQEIFNKMDSDIKVFNSYIDEFKTN